VSLAPIKHRFPNKVITGIRISQASYDIDAHTEVRFFLEKQQNENKGR